MSANDLHVAAYLALAHIAKARIFSYMVPAFIGAVQSTFGGEILTEKTFRADYGNRRYEAKAPTCRHGSVDGRTIACLVRLSMAPPSQGTLLWNFAGLFTIEGTWPTDPRHISIVDRTYIIWPVSRR